MNKVLDASLFLFIIIYANANANAYTRKSFYGSMRKWTMILLMVVLI